MKRLVLFVEGEGDKDAVPALVKRLLSEQRAFDYLFLDPHPFVIGGIHSITGASAEKWPNYIRAACKRRDVAAILLVLDGDASHVRLETDKPVPFCAAQVARVLTQRTREAGGGSVVSVACVFARQEFESWLIAGAAPPSVDSARGQPATIAGRPLKPGAPDIPADTEEAPRGAKGWLSQWLHGGYKPSIDQAALAAGVSLESLRARNPRSFRRLESALAALCQAIQSNTPTLTPA